VGGWGGGSVGERGRAVCSGVERGVCAGEVRAVCYGEVRENNVL
jgi:hypothetical protein